MHVTVVVPTYKTRDSINKLMKSLESQSYKDFSVMVIYKPWDGYKQKLDPLREYDLDIDFVRQPEGFFEEAMNVSYNKADGDVVIHTDDDAYASRNWISDHVDFHIKHQNVGIATGMVDQSTYPDGRKLSRAATFINGQKWRMNDFRLIDGPIDERFKGYSMYIGRSGMLVDTGRRHNMIKTFKQHGVNMSWKCDALHGFKFPGYSRVISRNEQAAALEVINRKFDAVWFDRGKVFHPLGESASRTMSTELLISDVIFSYYVSRFYDVDLGILRLRTRISDVLTRIATLNRNCGYEIGYEITSDAVKGRWQPHRVRKEEIARLSGIGES